MKFLRVTVFQNLVTINAMYMYIPMCQSEFGDEKLCIVSIGDQFVVWHLSLLLWTR